MRKSSIQKIITEALSAALEAKDEVVPRIVDFKGEWIKPDEKHIEDQIKLAACLYDTTYEDIVSKLKLAKPVTLTDKIWSKLDNTLSWHVATPEKAEEVADEYGYHYNDAKYGFMKNREVTLPVILFKKEKKPYVVSGETELLFAAAFKVKPKVLVIVLQ